MVHEHRQLEQPWRVLAHRLDHRAPVLGVEGIDNVDGDEHEVRIVLVGFDEGTRQVHHLLYAALGDGEVDRRSIFFSTICSSVNTQVDK